MVCLLFGVNVPCETRSPSFTTVPFPLACLPFLLMSSVSALSFSSTEWNLVLSFTKDVFISSLGRIPTGKFRDSYSVLGIYREYFFAVIQVSFNEKYFRS